MYRLIKSVGRVLSLLIDSEESHPIVHFGHALWMTNETKLESPAEKSHPWMVGLSLSFIRIEGSHFLRDLLISSPSTRGSISSESPESQEISPHAFNFQFMSRPSQMYWDFIAWILIFRNKFFNKTYNTKLVMFFGGILEAISKVCDVCSGIDRLCRTGNHNLLSSLFIGTLSGCGGSLLIDFEKKLRRYEDIPSNFSRPSWEFRASFWSSFLYYILIHHLRMCSAKSGRLLLVVLLMIHYTTQVYYSPLEVNYSGIIGLDHLFFYIFQTRKKKQN